MDKPTLKISSTKTIHVVDYSDFEKFVESIWGGSFEFVAIEEAHNDSEHLYQATGDIIDSYEADLEDIRNGEYENYCTQEVFNLLVDEKYIEPGTYLIKVSW